MAEELDELADDSDAPQDLGDGQDEVGCRGTLREAAGELEPDDLGDEHRDRLAEHGRLGLDTADPQPRTPSPLTIVVCESVPTRVSGNACRTRRLPRLDHAGEVLDVDLMDDSGARWDDLEVLEGGLSPAQEGVSLAVPLELELDVVRERKARGELVDLNRMVDDELCRQERVDA